MALIHRTLPFLLLFAAATACSSKKSGTAAKDPYATEAEFCTLWAKAACNKTVVGQCSGGGTDTAACVDAQSAFCLSALPANYTSDGDNAKACVEAVKKAYSDAKLTAAEVLVVRNFAAPCNVLSNGPSGEGETCSQRSDCDTLSGYDCIIRPGETQGSCQIPVMASGGDPCSDANVVCPDTHYCDGNNCLTRAAVGASCGADKPCAQDLQCLGLSGTETCQTKAGNSESCTDSSGCQSGLCSIAQGASSGICVNDLPLGPTEPLCNDLR
ncbi:MAG: hypothetical protein H6717_23685 [Polyangiaceae bacterium]|nr:hypothetical protein [Polyangiaceae bacterium]